MNSCSPLFRVIRVFRGSSLLALTAGGMFAAEPAPLSSADQQFFENKIRPVLVENCYKCHSRDADKVKGGLLLDSREALLHGGLSGAAIVPGDPEKSLLIEAIRYANEDLQMPPKGKKLTDQQIADLTEWVRRGAPDPRTLAAKGSSSSYAGVGRKHWAFQPVRKPAPPAVKNTSWAKSPIDNFILAKLEGSGLAPNPPADKRTLLRRVTFDLTGLPPSEQEVQAFIADTSPDAFAKVVDRLLASPHYGEQWGRYWMDVARYSDTKGDAPRREDPRFPHAWTYRDYVIDAFNRDKPFNQFIIEQLAADRVLEENRKTRGTNGTNGVNAGDPSSLAALGFLSLGDQYNGMANDIINDRIDVTTKAFLGLTVSCARCHDHKFDPIPTKDYYSLYGIFANTQTPKSPKEMPMLQTPARTPEYENYVAKLEAVTAKREAFEAEIAAMRKEYQRKRERPSPEKRREIQRRESQLQRELGDLEAEHSGAPARAHAVLDANTRPKNFPVLLRGEAQSKGDVVPRRFLEILSGPNRPEYKQGSGRLELARDIASPTNPMTARVLVNRVWQQHFGEGFVSTPDDLGNMSSPPTHPELLDYLAARFVEEGWSIKRLHRLILLSSVYQVSGENNPKYAEMDPDNKLLWRYNLRRLGFEEMHDALLAIAGALDPKVGGKSIPIGNADFATRRAVYTYIDRRNPAEILTQFDYPNPSVPTGRRYETIVPQQALFLMNSPLVIETARKLVHRPEFLALKSDKERVKSLYLAVYQRPPTEEETKLCISYVAANPDGRSTEAAPPPPMREQMSRRTAQRDAKMAEMASKGARGKNAPQVEPAAAAFQTRAPLDAWTKLAHALFQTNEAMFYN